MNIIRVTQEWQRAGVHYVRTEAMVKGFHIPLEKEFDQNDTPDTLYVLALDDVLPVATCRLHILDETTAKIERVCVLEQYRGKKVGKELIQAAERWLEELGIRKILITSRDEAVGFYEKLGYKADWSQTEKGGIFTTVLTEKNISCLTIPFGAEKGELPVAANRYRLLWTPACPWAHSQIIVLKLLGLDQVISIGTANPRRTEKGWEFSLDDGGIDPVLKIRYLTEIYEETDPDYTGRATVPAVVDLETRRVVNNDYFKLTNAWETVWKPFHKEGAPDLYPKELRTEIDELNHILLHEINNAIDKAGLATTQEEYEKNYELVFTRLDWLEERLSRSRYLFGNHVTDSDVRLYVILARFDAAYYFAFRLNRNPIKEFPNLWNYAKDLYSIPQFGGTTDFEAIKIGYLLSSEKEKNPYQIVANGPDASVWTQPNDRQKKFL